MYCWSADGSTPLCRSTGIRPGHGGELRRASHLRDFLGDLIGRGRLDGGEEPVVAQGGLETGVRLPGFDDGLGDLLVEGRDVGRRTGSDSGRDGVICVGH
jgi:hypothetical protein